MPRNTRIDINALRRFTQRNGDVFLYTPGYLCPCRVNGAPQSGCLICGGVGTFWDDDDRITIKGVVFTPQMHRELIPEGQYESGDLLLSQDNNYPHMNVNDRLELTTADGEPFEGEVRPVSMTTSGTRVTILSYQPTVIEKAFIGDPMTGTRIKYKIIENERNGNRDDDLRTDYDGYFSRLQDDGTPARWITWLPNRGPATGVNVSVKYRARFEFVVVEQPEYRFQRDNDLGQLVHLRLKHRMAAYAHDTNSGPEVATVDTPHDTTVTWH